MRVATYNIHDGAPDTLSQLSRFVDYEGLDLLCLQEANGWNDSPTPRREAFAERTGFQYHAFGKANTRFDLVTYSRRPILEAEVYTENLWHGAIRTTIAASKHTPTIDVWNIHLKPHTEDERLEEIKYLTSLMGKGEHIVVGDCNSLSRYDDYDAGLLPYLTGRGITKFGTTALRTEVTDYLEAANLIDVGAAFDSRSSTVPTDRYTGKFGPHKLRLDYIFVTSGLIHAVTDIQTPKLPLTHDVSNHYPVVLSLDVDDR